MKNEPLSLARLTRGLGLSTLTALLVGCSGGTDSGSGTGPGNATSINNQTLPLGTRLSADLTQSFNGSWQVTNLPAWLQVSSYSGTGNVNFTVTALRNAATPQKADAPSLSGTFNIVWKANGSGNSNTATVTVTADQYVLTGRVASSLTGTGGAVTGSDILPGTLKALAVTTTEPKSRGIIVKYRSQAVRDGVTGAGLKGNLQGQSVQAQSAEVAASRKVLGELAVPAAQVQAVGSRYAALRVEATPERLAALQADPNVESAVPNVILHEQTVQEQTLHELTATPVIPTDQYAPLQWAFPLMGYPAVWRDMQAGGYTHPVTVAVVDSGVRYEHPDLAGKLYLPGDGGLDLATGNATGDGDGVDTDPTDANGPNKSGSHGTHVSGIIVANWGTNTDGSTDVVGASYLAPIKVLPVRVIDSAGEVDAATVAQGILYAAGLPVTVGSTTYTNPHPAQVINLSLGGDMVTAEEAQVMCDAVAQASGKGSLVVAAAGNSGTTALYYPAACPGAVAVGSVTLSGNSLPVKASYSNSYTQVQLSAPGGVGKAGSYYNGGTYNGSAFVDRILSTGWDYAANKPGLQTEAGTSQAAPQVAALAALLLSKGVTQNATDTLQRMTSTATDLGTPGRDPEYGFGMINAAAALGAPAISSVPGVQIKNVAGQTFLPSLDALGRFTAYLGDGTYQVTGALDANGNGIFAETGEPSDTASATLGPATPNVVLRDLIPQ